MPDQQDAAEQALQQSKEQKRHSAEPANTREEESGLSLTDAVAEAYHDLDAGDLHENLTVRDENLAALIAGLEETGQLEAVGQRANELLGRDEDIDSRAALLKVLIRVGIHEVAADELDDAKQGRTQYIQEKESESGF